MWATHGDVVFVVDDEAVQNGVVHDGDIEDTTRLQFALQGFKRPLSHSCAQAHPGHIVVAVPGQQTPDGGSAKDRDGGQTLLGCRVDARPASTFRTTVTDVDQATIAAAAAFAQHPSEFADLRHRTDTDRPIRLAGA